MKTLLLGHCLEQLKTLPDESVNCVVTSPPYWGLRDYGIDAQIGLEDTPESFIENLTGIFREVRRVLTKDGTLWVNLGDGYYGSGKAFGDNTTTACKQVTNKGSQLHRGKKAKKPATLMPHPTLKPKDVMGLPWMFAFALRNDGWYLRSDIIWEKPNVMPESVRDRPTRSHEYIFLFTKSREYYYDADAIRDPNGRNKRSVWSVNTKPLKEAHFATYPPELIRPCILAGCPKGGTVMDPFTGSGTTGVVAIEENRKFVGIELNPEYMEIAQRRLNNVEPNLCLE